MSDDPKIMIEHYSDLKREQILAMEVGEELDKLVEKYVMNITPLTVEQAIKKQNEGSVWMFKPDGLFIDQYNDLVFNKDEYNKLFGHGCYIPDRNKWLLENSTIRTKTKPYSTDLYAAWEVVEKVKGNHDLFNVTFNGRWYVTIEDVIVDEENIVTDVKSYQYDHDNLPIALCKASLLAVMGL